MASISIAPPLAAARAPRASLSALSTPMPSMYSSLLGILPSREQIAASSAEPR